MPYNRELQYSIWDVTKAWTTITSVYCVKMVVGSSAYWCDMLIHWSKIPPMFLTEPLEVIEDEPICNVGLFRDFTQCGDAKYIIFVLLSCSLRRFWVIHCQISAIQCSKLFKEEEKFNSLSGSSDIYSCVSSAYK